MDFNWDAIKKLGKTKSVSLYKEAYPDLDFEKLYDQKFPKKKTNPKKKG